MIRIRLDELLKVPERAYAPLWRWKKDKKRVNFDTLEKICQILKIQPADLIASVELKPEIEADLRAKAAERGLSVEEFLQEAIEIDSENETTFSEKATSEEWEGALDEFINSAAFRNISWTVDDSRDSIYREREDAQL